MKKILVPVDFSSHAGISCSYAGELAAATGAEVVLFHSFFEQIYFSDGGFATGFESGIMLTDDLIRGFYKEKEKSLIDLKNKLEKKISIVTGKPINVTTVIESGDPQIQITIAVEKLEPDLVVMGSAGLGRKGFLAGSVCKHLMGATHVPVLAIPDILDYKGLENILYVTALGSGDMDALSHLSALLAGFSPKIHCLHLDVGQKDLDAPAEMELLKKEAITNKIIENIDFEVISCDDPNDCLRNFISGHGIQLIAFIPHKKNFFRIFTRQDLTKEDLFMTGLPILGIA
jgi:nucleotide-binding universal stress UspA family protein